MVSSEPTSFTVPLMAPVCANSCWLKMPLRDSNTKQTLFINIKIKFKKVELVRIINKSQRKVTFDN